jgi:hypothetical protein
MARNGKQEETTGQNLAFFMDEHFKTEDSSFKR